jgi:alkane 1-monooxygenase
LSASSGIGGTVAAQRTPLRYFAVCAVPAAAAIGIGYGNDGNWLGVAVYGALYLLWDAIGPEDQAPPLARDRALLTGILFLQLPLLVLAWIAFLAAFAAADPPGTGAAGFFAAIGLPLRGEATALELAEATLSFAVAVAIGGTVTAHELVHRTGSPAALLVGRLQLAFIFDAAFSIEHVYGHHARVGTWADPATARRGENVYRFIGRSTVQSFLGAWTIEAKRLARTGRPLWSWHNRNLRGIALSLALVAISAAAGGWLAAGAFVLAGALAKALLEATNYVEHYGLVRVAGTRVQPRHSWDTAAPISASGMFNLGRHAAHHIAVRPYGTLALEAESPKLPSGVVGSVFIAVIPPLWRRVMAPRLAAWDRDQATEEERALAAETEAMAARPGTWAPAASGLGENPAGGNRPR